jgi:2-dehydropantoate 2-reductase
LWPHGRKFPIGEPNGQHTQRIERLQQAMQSAGLEAPIRSDIRDEIWLKLWGNLCLSPISALTHASIDVVATDPGTRAIWKAVGRWRSTRSLRRFRKSHVV